MDLNCQLVTRTSKEGKRYDVIVIKLTDTYEKLVFIDSAEKELLKLTKDEVVKNPFDIN